MALTICLIGCGKWGRNILRDLIEIGVSVVVVDAEPMVLQEIASTHQVTTASSLEDLPSVDGFVVATPASTHADVIQQILPFRLPIFVEKPLTTDLQDARALERDGDGLIFVMHIWHYHAGVEMLANIRESGELGPVQMLRSERKNWTSPRLDVDSTWTLTPHDLSIAKRILGFLPEPRFATAEMLEGRVVGLLAELGNQAPKVIIDVSNRYRDKRREIRLHCELGVAVLPSDDAGIIEICREQHEQNRAEPKVETRKFEFVSPLQRELELFVTHLKGGPPPPTGLREGIEIVEAVASLRSLAGLGD